MSDAICLLSFNLIFSLFANVLGAIISLNIILGEPYLGIKPDFYKLHVFMAALSSFTLVVGTVVATRYLEQGYQRVATNPNPLRSSQPRNGSLQSRRGAQENQDRA